MTEDELDLLASTYLDGEATSEEVAMVEADPELLARVEALRSVSEQLGVPVAVPSGSLKEQQLAAAMAAFDSGAATRTEGDSGVDNIDNVTSIGSRQSARSKNQSNRSEDQSNRSRNRARSERPARSIPQWLPAAAGLLLLGGGVIWLAGQTGSDDADTAAMETSADSAESAGEDADDEGQASSAVADTDAMAAESAPAEGELAEADEEEAMEDAAADDSADDASDGGADEEAGAERSTTTSASPTTGGFFPQEPVLSFASIPDPDDLLGDLPDFRLDLSTSQCGPGRAVADGAEVVGYLPIEIEAEPAELLLVVDQAGAESVLIVDQTCNQLAP